MVQKEATARLGPRQLLAGVCTDNANNVSKSARHLANGEAYGCAAHTANLAMGDLIEARLALLMTKIRVRHDWWCYSSCLSQRLAVFFRKSAKKASKLDAVQERQPPLRLIVDGDTRWNCKYDMLHRMQELLPAIHRLRLKVAQQQADVPKLHDVLLPDAETRAISFADRVRILSECYLLFIFSKREVLIFLPPGTRRDGQSS